MAPTIRQEEEDNAASPFMINEQRLLRRVGEQVVCTHATKLKNQLPHSQPRPDVQIREPAKEAEINANKQNENKS